MNRMSKWALMGIALVPMQLVFGTGKANISSPNCPPKECPAPCPPKPCKPCPPVCFERGYPDNQCCLPSAYNEPAGYEMTPCPWDMWVDASFTYWLAYEDGLSLCVSAGLDGTNIRIPDGTWLLQDNKFVPGFKVGLGMDLGHDNWSALLEYTWFRSSTSTSSGAAPTNSAGLTPVWFSPHAVSQAVSAFSSVSSTWKLRMDILDAVLTRPYYQGTHLIVAPVGGMRFQWIRQNLNISTVPVQIGENAVNTQANLQGRSNSWALGPQVGLQARWHLGWNLRLEGDMSGNLLYTRYTKVTFSADPILATDTLQTQSRYRNYDTLRFGNSFNLGLGWGDYFACRNYHLDLLLTYDFQAFWNQNMMRHLLDDTTDGSGASPGNLYLQGLTFKAQFDF